MNIDTFDIDENSIKNNSNAYKRYSVESLKEYNLAINDIDEEQENTKNIKKEIKIKKKLPFLVYIFILTAIFLLSTLILFVIVLFSYKENYKKEENIYLRPSISEHNYSRIIFDNGLEIILIQVHFNDTAGGSITFDTGYLDQKYEPGFLRLALDSLKFNDINNYKGISEYMAEIYHNSEEFYSSTYFTILNSGFQNFLENFKDNTFFFLP